MSLLNRHENERSEGLTHAYGVVLMNTPTKRDELHYVAMMTRRQRAYVRDELRNTGIEHATIVQMVMMDYVLHVRKRLFISVAELIVDPTYDYYRTRKRTLYDAYALLNTRGLLERRARIAKSGKALVTTWGFTAKGRAMLRKYYAYLSGEYDHLL